MSPATVSRLGSLRAGATRFSDSFGTPWESSISLVRDFEQDCRRGEAAPVADVWADRGRDAPVSVLAALIKAELRARFDRGEKPTAAEYLTLFPQLREERDRVVSLVYEEYCLREETGESPDPESFCGHYAPWRDSLLSQLQYHRNLSQVIAPASRPLFPETGTWFAEEFHLRSLLGSGGAGRVFLADQPECHRQVALKVTPENDQDIEPSLLGRLDHDHIMPVWSVVRDRESGLRGLCMPYRPGLPLDEVINRIDPKSRPRRALSLLATVLPTAAERRAILPKGWHGFPVQGSYARAVAWLGATVARALAHAHERQVFHRDVKPANILLTSREGPQLLDFNLAHAPTASDQAAAARSGGTLPYMAPEQLRAFIAPAHWTEVGAAADLFALGLVLRELLTGERPDAPDRGLPLPRAVQEMLDHRALPAAPIRSLNPDVPHALAAIIDRCLAFEPSDRYPDAASLAADLQRFVDFDAPRHVRNPSRREAASHWLRRNRLGLATAAALILAVAAAGLGRQWSLNRSEQKRDREHQAIRQVSWGRNYLDQKRWNLARDAFERARELDPKLYTAWHGLGSVAVNIENFATADRLLTRAIDAAIQATPTVPAAKIADLYLDRGRSRYSWGRSLLAMPEQQRDASADDDRRDSPSSESESHLVSALTDINQARRWKLRVLGNHSLSTDPEASQALVALEYVAANIEMGLANIARLRGERDQCLAHYQNARNKLTEALRIRSDDMNTLKALLTVLTGLQEMRPGDEAVSKELHAMRSRLRSLERRTNPEMDLLSTSMPASRAS